MIKLSNLIPKYIKNLISELRLTPDSESNLHKDERTQRQFVIDLASENPYGLISISDIADALNTTRDAIRNNYARQIRFFANKDDFTKIVTEVPFRSAAVYQLVSHSKSAPLSRQQLDKIQDEEELKYKKTTGVFYPVYMRQKNVGKSTLMGLLNLRQNDDVKLYQQLLPAPQVIEGDVYTYSINDKKMNRVPETLNTKIIPKNDFEAFVEKEM